MSIRLPVIAAIFIAAAAISGTMDTRPAAAQTQQAASQSGSTGIKARTRETWAQMKARWAKQKERWADCQKQGKAKGLSGRKSRVFLETCMNG